MNKLHLKMKHGKREPKGTSYPKFKRGRPRKEKLKTKYLLRL